MSKQMIFTIDTTGKVNVEAKGYGGRGCRDATKVFEDALGAVEERKEKHDTETRQEVEREEQY